MSDPFRACVGMVVSADIAVPEHARELNFYSRVLTTGDAPFWGEDLSNNLGQPIIGLGERIPEYAELPLQWMPHIQVADVATSAARAIELGAKEILHGRDDDGNSLWAGLSDPNGAGFGLIPVVPAEAMPSVGEAAPETVGRIAWLDLTVADAAATCEFYRQVIGWSVQEVEVAHGAERYTDYLLIDGAGLAAAGVRHARGANRDLPAVWLHTLPVGDIEESLRRVADGGGEVLQRFEGDGGFGARAVVRDPVGVLIALAAG